MLSNNSPLTKGKQRPVRWKFSTQTKTTFNMTSIQKKDKGSLIAHKNQLHPNIKEIDHEVEKGMS